MLRFGHPRNGEMESLAFLGDSHSIPATKKKYPMKTFVTVKLRHSISESDSVVNVVANAPIASAVYNISQNLISRAVPYRISYL